MRGHLLVYRADPPVERLEADPAVGRLLTLLAARGAFAGGEHLAVVVDEGPPPDAAVPARFHLVGRWPGQVLATAAAPVQPALVAPDPTVRHPRPVGWERIELVGGNRARVTFMRGVVERLHSVEVTTGPAGAAVTVKVGTLADFGGGPVVAVGIVEQTEVELPFRVDGGPTSS